jgi:hypothetical protein
MPDSQTTEVDVRSTSFYLYYYFPDNQTRHPFYLMGLKKGGRRSPGESGEAQYLFPYDR